jgi:hypothetical protein
MTYTWQHRLWVLYCAWKLVILSVFLMVFLSHLRPHTHTYTQFQLVQCTISAFEELSLNKQRYRNEIIFCVICLYCLVKLNIQLVLKF